MKKWPDKRGSRSWGGQFSRSLLPQCIWNMVSSFSCVSVGVPQSKYFFPKMNSFWINTIPIVLFEGHSHRKFKCLSETMFWQCVSLFSIGTCMFITRSLYFVQQNQSRFSLRHLNFQSEWNPQRYNMYCIYSKGEFVKDQLHLNKSDSPLPKDRHCQMTDPAQSYTNNSLGLFCWPCDLIKGIITIDA